MSTLLWFSGIVWETPVRDIGWTWVLVAILFFTLVILITKIAKLLKGGNS